MAAAAATKTTMPGSAGDAKLIKLGLDSAVDRRRVMAIVTGDEDPPTLINWYQVRYHSRTEEKSWCEPQVVIVAQAFSFTVPVEFTGILPPLRRQGPA